MLKQLFLIATLALAIGWNASAQADTEWKQKFEQLGPMLPTPNTYRTASGAPGKDYWQMQADYKMAVTLDDSKQQITGKETITYYNNSPDPLDYLWVQLDQNMRADDSDTPLANARKYRDTLNVKDYYGLANSPGFEGGFNVHYVKSAGADLKYKINKTMMRVDLTKTLQPGEKVSFDIEWDYFINDRMTDGGRSGLEYFPEEDNYLYTIAQFFPRMAVYSDNEGWQNKQFLGSGEFALSFGSYEVAITVPSDFVIGSTGTLQNPKDVLTKEQQKRLAQAKKSFDKPVFIVTEEEAIANEKTKDSGTKTWVFQADSIRDFAFAASRKFIWDAMAVDINGKTPLAMSYYPKEGNPLWEEYSTRVVAQTLETYSKYTIDYPYSKAISVHTASIGMEYPMICFNYGRPNEDGTYSDRTKYGMIGVIIHEVGHNFFPMIINSDERQWTWMDEGLNTFVQYLTEKDFEVTFNEPFPSRRGPADKIVPYMSGERGLFRPIMTNSEQILQFGNNAYAKPATALNVLREVVMGPELFDYAFKKYAERWAFKNPSPADFFRTMEDASAVDLDWFWRGWFYSTDAVDVNVANVEWYRMASEDNQLESKIKNSKDLSNSTSQINQTPKPLGFEDVKYRGEFKNTLDEESLKAEMSDKNFYKVTFKNEGGLVTPLLIEWTYDDGSKEFEKLPAEIWRKNEQEVTKMFIKDKKVVSVSYDPFKETADVNEEDNVFPRVDEPSRFEKFKGKK
ncbi:M1 family metallopeptidase [Marinoscillum pacificum]|uniref:M1 family metallopeptidase n=1 Tax=Marinoscillum pacificum TaxID=392723 RepID=UPI0021588C72|nr:M1 family metallopeptidase [Marinoscillum pacificum]